MCMLHIKEHSCSLFLFLETFLSTTNQLTEGIHSGFIFSEIRYLRAKDVIFLQKPQNPLIYHSFKQLQMQLVRGIGW